MPKALADTGSGPWVLRALELLEPCDQRLVVLGDRADDVAALLPAGVQAVRNPSFESGMGSSLRAGLSAIDADVDAVVVMLVDLPDLVPDVLRRVLLGLPAEPRQALLRAAFDGRPGHPVLIGRDHVIGVLAAAHDDTGARDYLRAHSVGLIECGDLAGGDDVDTSDPGPSA